MNSESAKASARRARGEGGSELVPPPLPPHPSPPLPRLTSELESILEPFPVAPRLRQDQSKEHTVQEGGDDQRSEESTRIDDVVEDELLLGQRKVGEITSFDGHGRLSSGRVLEGE